MDERATKLEVLGGGAGQNSSQWMKSIGGQLQ